MIEVFLPPLPESATMCTPTSPSSSASRDAAEAFQKNVEGNAANQAAAAIKLVKIRVLEVLADEHGVTVPTTGHTYPVDPAAVRDAIARRKATRASIDQGVRLS